MMINLKAPTIHAIKILKYMEDSQTGEPDALVMGKDVAASIKVAQSYFMRVVKELQKAGIVRSVQGRMGGFQLVKSPEDISLYEIMDLMESDRTAENLLQESLGALEEMLQSLSENMEYQLRQIKISDI